jgi:membrane protease YdiL (CAAX protease family)
MGRLATPRHSLSAKEQYTMRLSAPRRAAGAQHAPSGHRSNPVVRIVIAGAMVFVSVAVAETLVRQLRGDNPSVAYYLTYSVVSVLTAFGAYRLYVHLLERRRPIEIARAGAATETAAGVLLGTAMVAGIVGILWLAGDYRVDRMDIGIAALAAFASDIAGAVVEEILLRAIVLRIASEALGIVPAVVISAVLFGLLHLGSPAAIPSALAAGALLSLAYVLTGRLWLAIGLHFGWDYAQDAIFGVSADAVGIVRARLSGSAWLTGGDTGIESSLLGLAVILLVSAVLLWLIRSHARQSGAIVTADPGLRLT